MDETKQIAIHSLKAPDEIEAELENIGVLVAGNFSRAGDGWDVLVDADSAQIGTLRTLGYQVAEA